MDLTGNTFIKGPVGRLEAILKEPNDAIRRVAIICHPHPLFGGTMHNKVVYRIAKAFQEAGFAALRFNFRGTGRSEGGHDHGRGEQDDLRAAIAFMQAKHPNTELWLAGFSFGASVTLRVGCHDDSARALVIAGLPVSKYDFTRIAVCDKPRLFIQGAQDEFGSVTDMQRFVDTLTEPKQLAIIDDADHFFEGRLDEVSQAVAKFIASVES